MVARPVVVVHEPRVPLIDEPVSCGLLVGSGRTCHHDVVELALVVVGGVLAIVGGVIGNYWSSQSSQREARRAARRVAYEHVLRVSVDCDRYWVDIQSWLSGGRERVPPIPPSAGEVVAAETLVLLYGSVDVRSAWEAFQVAFDLDLEDLPDDSHQVRETFDRHFAEMRDRQRLLAESMRRGIGE